MVSVRVFILQRLLLQQKGPSLIFYVGEGLSDPLGKLGYQLRIMVWPEPSPVRLESQMSEGCFVVVVFVFSIQNKKISQCIGIHFAS